MTREADGRDCKVCTRPYTIFRWNPGSHSKLRKTEICTLCAKLKNVCQSCILDLDYGLPAHVRDQVLQSNAAIPTSEVNTEYFVQNMANREDADTTLRYGKADSAAKELLKSMTRKDPYHDRNKVKPCSFFAKGECHKGNACPFR